MIKFFRKLRQKLLAENKFSKYLLYAIGEIILVVIGILIALQINTWNEHKKTLAKERLILASLLEDFDTNSRHIETSLQFYIGTVAGLEKKMNYVGRNTKEFDQKIKDDIIGVGFWNPGFVSGTLNSIIYSEQLGLIKNNELKNTLTYYTSDIDNNLELIEQYRVMLTEKHQPLIDSYISLLDISNLKQKYPELSHNILRTNYNGLLNDSRFQNLLLREISHCNRYIGVTTSFLNKTNYIIDLIREELDLPIKLERLITSDKTIDAVIEIIKQQDIDDPNYDVSEDSIINLGYKLMEKDEDDKALKLFKVSTELYPDAWNTHDSYGECLLKMGDKENAIKAYKKSLEIKPDNEYAIKALSELE